MREIVVDTETTGLSYKNGDQIIEIACIELINHVASGAYLQFYCSVDKTVGDEALKVHGLSNNFLNKFPNFGSQVNKFLKFIKDDTLVIHNAEFDIGFINNELQLSNIGPLKNKAIDTVLLARKTLNTRIVNLDSLCKKFSIDLSHRKFHGALLDCQLLSEVYLELLGGRQTSMDLIKTNEKAKKTKQIDYKTKNKIHEVEISTNEINEHKNFVADLSNALWHKVDY